MSEKIRRVKNECKYCDWGNDFMLLGLLFVNLTKKWRNLNKHNELPLKYERCSNTRQTNMVVHS